MKESPKDECNDLKTPCFKETSNNTFVAMRSNYSELPDFSPLPDSFSNVADEDTWFKMNKGYIADLDSLQTTPATKVQSFPPQDITPVSRHSKSFFFFLQFWFSINAFKCDKWWS